MAQGGGPPWDPRLGPYNLPYPNQTGNVWPGVWTMPPFPMYPESLHSPPFSPHYSHSSYPPPFPQYINSAPPFPQYSLNAPPVPSFSQYSHNAPPFPQYSHNTQLVPPFHHNSHNAPLVAPFHHNSHNEPSVAPFPQSTYNTSPVPTSQQDDGPHTSDNGTVPDDGSLTRGDSPPVHFSKVLNADVDDSATGEIISVDALLGEYDWDSVDVKTDGMKDDGSVQLEDTDERDSNGRGSPADTISEQSEDAPTYKRVGKYSLKDVRNFLTRAEDRYPATCEDKDKSNFRRLCSPFLVQEGKLLHRTHAGKCTTHGRDKETFPDWVLVLESRREQLRMLKMAHEGSKDSLQSASLSAHRGIRTTTDILARRVYWPGFSQDVKDYVRSCDTCQRVNAAVLKVGDTLRPVPAPTAIFKQIGVDLIQLPEAYGFRYAVIAIDYLSKYPHGKPLETKRASEVAKFLFEWVTLFGYPQVIINDQGKEFCNAVSDEFQKLTGVNQRVTRAYNPQANGLVERENRSIKAGLLKVLMEDVTEWPNVLDGVLFALRTQVQRSTGYSPYFMAFGREPTLPMDYDLQSVSNESEMIIDDRPDEGVENEVTVDEFVSQYGEGQDVQSIVSFVSKHTDLKSKVLSKARENIKDSQDIQKKHYDHRHGSGYTFKVGDIVLKRNLRRENRKGDWKQLPWTGKYEIVAISKNKLCTLKNCTINRVLARKETQRNLKLYIAQPDHINDSMIDNEDEDSEMDSPEVLTHTDNGNKTNDDIGNGNGGVEGAVPIIILDNMDSDEDKCVSIFDCPTKIGIEDIENMITMNSDVRVVKGGAITVQEIKILMSSEWLNDEIINTYMKIICTHANQKGLTAHGFPTFFFDKIVKSVDSVKTWTKNVDIFQCNVLLVPINLPSHWALCAVHIQNQSLTYFDSMNGNGLAYMKTILKYLSNEHVTKKGSPLDENKWELRNAQDAARQENSFDCGTYILFYARMIAAEKPCRAPPRAITRLRRQIAQELVSGQLRSDDFLEDECTKDEVHNPQNILYIIDRTADSATPSPKPVGLCNLGQTCYLNACIQALFHCSLFSNWLRSELRHKCSAQVCTTCALASTFATYTKSSGPFSPQRLVDNIECFWEMYGKGQQQDAQEFLSRLFVVLIKEFLAQYPANMRLDYRSELTTPLNEMFGGFLRTDIICNMCATTFTSYQEFLFYTVEASYTSVQEALEASILPVDIDYKCQKCAGWRKAKKALTIEKHPRLLLVHIKRFTADGHKIKTLRPAATVALNNVIHPDSPAKNTNSQYKLQSNICHAGETLASGHYTALVKSARTNRFHKCDDAKVEQSTLKKALAEPGYIVLYELM